MMDDKIKVLHVKHNKNIDMKEVNIKADALQMDDKPQFSSECIFQVKEVSTTPLIGRIVNRNRRRHPAVIYLDGKPFCEKLKSSADLIEPITDADRKRIVEREIAKTLGKFKVMSPWMFIILAIMLGIVIVMLFMVLKGVQIG